MIPTFGRPTSIAMYKPYVSAFAAYAVFLLVLLGIPICSASLSSVMIREFFEMKSIGALYLKSCTLSDALKLTRYLNVEFKFYTKIMRSTQDMNESLLFDTPGRIGVYFDMTCQKNIKFLQEAASAESSFALRWSWLIDIGTKAGLEILSSVNLGFVNDVTVATQSDQDQDSLALYSAYSEPFSNMRLVTVNVGFWSGSKGLTYSLPQKDYSLEKSTLKAAIFMTQDIYHDDELYAELQNKTYMSSLDTANRFYYAVSLHIADLHNYSLELVKSDDWGDRLANGSFSGMLGMLKSGKADLTVGPVRLANERLDAASPLFPIQRFMFPFVFKQPRRTGTYKALALQLKIDVWMYTGMMATLTCLTLSAIQWLRNLVKRKTGGTAVKKEEESVSFNAILVIGTMSQQGLMSDPPDVARRIACFWLLFCFLMVATYYNAATMNALLSPSPVSIRNLDELLASDVRLALNDAPYFTHPTVRAVILEQDIIDRVNHFSLGFLSLDQGLQLILEGGAFCGEDFTLFKGIHARFQDEQKCDLSVIQASRPFPSSFWIPKNSPYKEIMFQGTLRVKEHGLIDRQYRYWYPARPECLMNQQWLWVGLEAVTIALLIFVFGFLISSTVFILEIASSLKIRRQK